MKRGPLARSPGQKEGMDTAGSRGAEGGSLSPQGEGPLCSPSSLRKGHAWGCSGVLATPSGPSPGLQCLLGWQSLGSLFFLVSVFSSFPNFNFSDSSLKPRVIWGLSELFESLNAGEGPNPPKNPFLSGKCVLK